MFQYIAITAGLLMMSSMTFAQDLNGTWVRDGERSDVVPDSMYWTVRGITAGGTRGPGSNHVIQIVRDTNSMQITDPARPLRVYVLDGAERTMLADTGVTNATIKAFVQGDAVIVERSQLYSGLPGSVTLKTEEYWTLSQDGNSVVLTTIRETPARRITYNEVYNRQ